MDTLNPIPIDEEDDIISPDDDGADQFRVEDDDTALWAMRKLYERGERVEQVRARGRAELERLDKRKRAVEAWVEQETADDRRFMEYLYALLAGYGAQQRRDGKRNSVSTPYGKVTTRKAQDTVDIADEDALLAHVRSTGAFELVKLVPRKAEVKAATLKDGEILPGVTVHRAEPDEFTVDVKPGLA